MAERRIRQVAVVDGTKVVGLVSERDLFALQRVSMRQVSDALRAARDRPSLQRAADDIRALTQNLLAQGAAAEPLTRTIAALNDALSRQVIEMVLARHELPDSDWCWLALGSEGRGEQTFATDQDNALVFVPQDPASVEAERARLLAFARDVNTELDAIGFPLCTGDVMAGQSEDVPDGRRVAVAIPAWIREPTPEALLSANIVFDFRPLYGDTTLVDELRAWLGGFTRDNKRLPAVHGAQRAARRSRRSASMRAFVTDDTDAQKGTLDLKARGTPHLRRRGARVRARVRAAGDRDRGAPARGRCDAQRRTPPRRRNDRRLPLPAAPAAAQSARPGDALRAQPHRSRTR